MEIFINLTKCKTPGISNLFRYLFYKWDEVEELSHVFKKHGVVLCDTLLWKLTVNKEDQPFNKVKSFINDLREACPFLIFETWLLDRNNYPSRYTQRNCKKVMFTPNYSNKDIDFDEVKRTNNRLIVPDALKKTEFVKIYPVGSELQVDVSHEPMGVGYEHMVYHGEANGVNDLTRTEISLLCNPVDDYCIFNFKTNNIKFNDFVRETSFKLDKERMDLLVSNLRTYSKSIKSGCSESLILNDFFEYYRNYLESFYRSSFRGIF